MGKVVPIVLAVVCAVLLVVCVILGILLASATKKGPGVCSTARCLEDAARIRSFLNESVDPCDNFYDFACGNFPKERGDPTAWIADNVLESVRRLLEEPIKDTAENSTERKMKEYYGSCLESDVTEEEKMASLRELVTGIGGFSSNPPADKIDLENFNPTTFDFDAALQYLHFDLSTNALISRRVVIDQVEKSDTLESYVSINSARQVCEQHYENGTLDQERISYIGKMVDCFGVSSRARKAFVASVVDITNIVCNVEDPAVNFTSKRLTWNELLDEEPWLRDSKVDWFSLFSKPFREWNHQPFKLDPKGLLMMKHINYINEKPNIYWKFRNYLVYSFLTSNKGLPKCFVDAYFDTEGISDKQNERSQTKWKTCIRRHLNPAFSFGVLAILEKQMDPPIVTDEKIHTMVEEIREAVLKRTLALPWLDDYLKERIKKKVESIEVMIAGPRRVLDDDYVDHFFQNININESQPFLVNDINARKFQAYVEAVALRSPSVHYLLYVTFTDAMFANAMNAVYYGGIVLFWPIMKLPFYHHYSQEYLQYGALGVVIGHEFGHDFDGDSTYEYWANKTEVPEVVESDLCLQDYYRNIEYPGWEPPLKNESEWLSGQGIPDLMGLQWVLEAYRKHVADRGREDEMLAGLPYTQEQLFHIADTQGWCNSGEGGLFMTIRPIGAQSLNPNFAEVFNCPKDAPMNPTNKCNVWS